MSDGSVNYLLLCCKLIKCLLIYCKIIIDNSLRIIIDDSQEAKGVKVDRFGQSLSYFAKNEVILSAGAIGSPQA